MGQLLAAFGPILVFLLIPLIAVTAGAISDQWSVRRSRAGA